MKCMMHEPEKSFGVVQPEEITDADWQQTLIPITVVLVSADLFGDWQEEIVFYDANDPSKLRIYTTTIPTEHHLYALMHVPVYRLGIAWQQDITNHLIWDSISETDWKIFFGRRCIHQNLICLENKEY